MAMMQSCSSKKNTAATRNYQAFITRYNIHFNGQTHYDETLNDMERKYEDDFTRLLFTHPAEARADKDAPQPQGDFTRSIEKAQKALQLRSIKKKPARKPGKSSDPAYKAWLKREEYNPFLHNSWMLMGRSQFMGGDFSGAATTFMYIAKHFNWLPATVTEAQLWQARSYCAMDWLFEAETILNRIKTDELTSKSLRALYNTTWADLLVRQHQYEQAIPYLTEAVKLTGGAQKTRLTFLLGQVHALVGNRSEAYRAYGRVASNSGAPYRTQFNARIKQSEVFEGDDISSEVARLNRMTRYSTNREFRDQIYYAIGNLYLSRRDTTNAIENYIKAADVSTRNGIDKAISQVTLGGLYYDRHQYDLAQPRYAEGISQLPQSYPDYAMLKRRSDILDELAVYSQNVTLQDSLLRLSYMTPEEQMRVVERIIEELKKKEKEEAEAAAREEFLNSADANPTLQDGNNAPTTFSMNSNGSWYFYNPSTVSAGKTEFQRRWGNRRLEDDWRRRNKAAFSFDDFNTSSDDEDDAEKTDGEGGESEMAEGDAPKPSEDPHDPQFYLQQIPSDSISRQQAHDVIQEGLYNMGVILKDKLEDYPAAYTSFEDLNERYPDNIYRLDAYYNMYLMAARDNDRALMEHYRQLILSEFAESNQGIALRDPEYIESLRRMEQEEKTRYDQALDAYFNNRNDEVHRAYTEMAREYSMSPLMPKFMFIDALAYVTDREPEKFREAIGTLLERYPESDVATYASSWMKGLSQGRELNQDAGGNVRGFLWDIKLSADTTSTEAGDEALDFLLDPDSEHILVLLYPADKISANTLLYDIARFNFTTFAVKDFDLEVMNFGSLGLLLVKGFDNERQLNRYRTMMEQNTNLMIPEGVVPVIISAQNFDTLLKNGASFDQYFRFLQENPPYEPVEE